VLWKKSLTTKTFLALVDVKHNDTLSSCPGTKIKKSHQNPRLRNILPFSQGHALKWVVQLKDIKGKEIFLGRGSTLLLCKKLIVL